MATSVAFRRASLLGAVLPLLLLGGLPRADASGGRKPAAQVRSRPRARPARAVRPRVPRKPRALPLGAVEHTFRNGLRLIVVPTRLKNVVSLQIPVQVGSRNEVEAGKSGFAHFFEHMKFRGTKTWPADKAEELVTRLGVQRNAYTSNDLTNYHSTFLKQDLETMIAFEADNFRNLSYDKQAFQDEAGAISGEARQRYSPGGALYETLMGAAFSTHPYKHPVIGTPQDIANMPGLYRYSRKFFKRHYRPDRMTLVLSGDVEPSEVIRLVEKHWGDWNPARPEIPAVPKEPPPSGPVYRHVDWKSPTPTAIDIAVRSPGFSDRNVGHSALQLAFEVATGPSSPVYRKLVIEERKVTDFGPFTPDSVDPGLFVVSAELVDPADAAYVRDEILKALVQVTTRAPARSTLEAVKSRRRYQLESRWESAPDVAASVARFAHHNRSFGTMDRYFARLQEITPEQVVRAARRYIRDQSLVVGTVSHQPLPAGVEKIPSLASLRAAIAAAPPAPSPARTAAAARPRTPAATARAARGPAHRLGGKNLVVLKTDMPLVNVELRFDLDATADPPGKEGLAHLSAAMLTDAGSRGQTLDQIIEELYPTAGSFSVERTSSATRVLGKVHRDQWKKFVDVVTPMVTDPGFRALDFERLKQEQIKTIEDLRSNVTGLATTRARGNVYAGTRLATPGVGTVATVEALKLQDVVDFVRGAYARDALRVGLAGKVDRTMVDYLQSRLARLPAKARTRRAPAVAARRAGRGRLEVEIVEKADAPGTSLALARPLDLPADHPDHAALLIASSALGGGSGSRVFDAIRTNRGLSYGAYASTRAGAGGSFVVYSQPVPEVSATMAVRIAMHELDQMVTGGLTAAEFAARKEELLRGLVIGSSTQGEQLASSLAGQDFGVTDLNAALRDTIDKLTLEDVNRAIKKHLAPRDWSLVIVTRDGKALRKQLTTSRATPIAYDSPKPAAILAEDERIAAHPLGIRAADVRVTPAERVFAR
jgi:zinc protease